MYLQALGRAVYNFAYLELVVMHTIARVSPDGFDSVPKGETAKRIAGALANAIQHTSPPLSRNLHRRLAQFHKRFGNAIKVRNKLIHAHPSTTHDGAQQFWASGYEWPIETVYEAAKLFEDLAIEGNAIYYSDLSRERS